MVSIETVRKFALSFPETDEHPHFDKKAFRVKKKIFITITEKEKRVMVKLSLTDQSVFCSFDKNIIYPVPGAWGRLGCTLIDLSKIKTAMLKDAVTMAYCNVAPPKLADPYRPV
ncbi:MAG: MmcQ/YjbR family DNA-binding protein [Chitinophagaceae bacterium]